MKHRTFGKIDLIKAQKQADRYQFWLDIKKLLPTIILWSIIIVLFFLGLFKAIELQGKQLEARYNLDRDAMIFNCIREKNNEANFNGYKTNNELKEVCLKLGV